MVCNLRLADSCMVLRARGSGTRHERGRAASAVTSNARTLQAAFFTTIVDWRKDILAWDARIYSVLCRRPCTLYCSMQR